MRRVVVIALLGALLVAHDARAATSSASVERLAGVDRYDTASTVAASLHPDGSSIAVVATGTSYPDALAAGVAAAALDAPLLLASPDRLPRAALAAMGVDHVILIGGTAVFPEATVEELGGDVERIAGDDRYGTAAAVSLLTESEHTIVAPGGSFPTALVAAVHAARLDARLLLSPVLAADELLVDGAALRGDPGRLNLALLAQFPPTSQVAVVTTIASYPDALSATAVAGALDAGVLFTKASSATTSSVDALATLAPEELLVIGGTAAVSEVVLQQLVGFVPLPPVVAAGAEAAIAYDVFARVNAERIARGVWPLAWDPSLAADAAAWARTMSTTGFRHAALGRNVGENIHQPIGRCIDGACVLPTSGRLHHDWMHVADNRDNIVEPGYVIGGVGVFCGPDGTLWAVERFGLGYGTLSAGGSPPAPVVRDDTAGFDCTLAHS